MTVSFPSEQFPSWWANEHEISSWLFSRNVWIYYQIFSSTLPSSRKPKEGELFAHGGNLCFEFNQIKLFYLYLFHRELMWILSQACKIVEGQRYTKGLNEKQITSLLKFSCQRPREQEADILQVTLSLVLDFTSILPFLIHFYFRVNWTLYSLNRSFPYTKLQSW